MSAYPNTDAVDHNPPVFSVTALAQAIRTHLEGQFGTVRVRGEISGLRRAASGHCYFALKDSEAIIDSVCWRTVLVTLSIAPEDGLDVVVTGRLTTYPGRSRYQIVVSAIEVAGEGALLKMLDERRRRLEKEGLFDERRKKPLPFLPDVVGVVTSETGAVFQDILHRIAERCPRRILLWPVLVQGPTAAEQIADAVAGFNALADRPTAPCPDVIIVARGGGSLEDLMAFNEEVVVRAVAASRIPVISAVGHETDTTLIDFAADIRAPTPTAAAEKAVPVRAELLAQISDLSTRLMRAMSRFLDQRRAAVDGHQRALPTPARLLADARQRLDELTDRQDVAMRGYLDRHRRISEQIALRLVRPKDIIQRCQQTYQSEARLLDAMFAQQMHAKRERLNQLVALLESFSYQSVLRRGFALIKDQDGQTISTVRTVAAGQRIDIHWHDGSRAAVIDGRSSAAARKRSPGSKAPPTQPTLL